MKITLPLPPNMANSRFHWRVKHNKRKAYFEICGPTATLLDLNRELRRHTPFPKTKIKATIYCGGRMDHDNALSRLKWPIDWMVQAGILVGDKPSQLEWYWPIEQVIKRDGKYRVEFELEAA